MPFGATRGFFPRAYEYVRMRTRNDAREIAMAISSEPALEVGVASRSESACVWNAQLYGYEYFFQNLKAGENSNMRKRRNARISACPPTAESRDRP